MAETRTAKGKPFDQQNERAIREAREADRIEPRAALSVTIRRKG
jgi:hypothetical protein